MKINIIAIGKIKEDYLKSGINEYAKRIRRFAQLNLIEKEESKNIGIAKKDIDARKINESENLMCSAKGYTIILDSRGEKLTSEEFAAIIKRCKDKGEEMSFLIGGSDGLEASILNKSNEIISFGNITYPHQLMRLILTEQIYRAFMIITNSSYHK